MDLRRIRAMRRRNITRLSTSADRARSIGAASRRSVRWRKHWSCLNCAMNRRNRVTGRKRIITANQLDESKQFLLLPVLQNGCAIGAITEGGLAKLEKRPRNHQTSATIAC